MSRIHTAELNDVAPFEYLVALQRHSNEVAAHPADWMPWNYQATLASQNPGPEPPPISRSARWPKWFTHPYRKGTNHRHVRQIYKKRGELRARARH